MAEDDRIGLLRAAFEFQCALVGNPSITEDEFKKAQQTAKEIYSELENVVRPWASKTIAEREQDGIDALVSLYKTRVGDPDDPEFRKKLLHDAEFYSKQDTGPAAETEEHRIDRLIKERNEFYARQRQRKEA